MKSTTIWVSEYVKKKLDKIKERNGHKSYDSVLRYLLERAGESDFIAHTGDRPILKEGDFIKIGDKCYKVVEVKKICSE